MLFEKRRVKGSLQVQAEERFSQSLTHLMEEAVKDLAEFGIQAVMKLLPRIAQLCLKSRKTLDLRQINPTATRRMPVPKNIPPVMSSHRIGESAAMIIPRTASRCPPGRSS